MQERSRRGSKRYNYEGAVVSDPSTWKVTNRGKTHSYPVFNPKVGTEFTALVFDIVRKLQKMGGEGNAPKKIKKRHDLFIFHLLFLRGVVNNHNLYFPYSSALADFGLLLSMSAVFLVVYPTHMYVTEVYLATSETHFLFMAFKYCFGCLHLVLLPMVRRTAMQC